MASHGHGWHNAFWFLCDPSPGCPETGPTVFGQTGPPEQHQTLKHVNPSPLAKSNLFLTRLDTWHHMAKFDIYFLKFLSSKSWLSRKWPNCVWTNWAPQHQFSLEPVNPSQLANSNMLLTKLGTWHHIVQGWHNATWTFVIQVLLVQKLAQLCLAKQGPCGGSVVVVILVICNILSH